MGQHDAALAALPGAQHLSEHNSKALVHAGLRDREAMFGWLGKAYTAHDVHLLFLPADPKWDRYRADQRFADLLAVRVRSAAFEADALTAPPTD
jgi:hypothetical protein